jgi:hypothetical protein
MITRLKHFDNMLITFLTSPFLYNFNTIKVLLVADPELEGILTISITLQHQNRCVVTPESLLCNTISVTL